jgi:hypothetical protein
LRGATFPTKPGSQRLLERNCVKIVGIEEIRCTGCSKTKPYIHEINRWVCLEDSETCGDSDRVACEKLEKVIARTESFRETCQKNCSGEEFSQRYRAFFTNRKYCRIFKAVRNPEGRGSGRQLPTFVQKYGYMTIVSIALSPITGGKLNIGYDGQMICSGLMARALERTTAIFNRTPSHIMPADLAKFFSVEPPPPGTDKGDIPTA